MFNQAHAGRYYRYAYSTTAKPGWFLFNGFVKHDLETGESWSLPLEPGRYASEAPFAPRVGATGEDDGYLVSFIIDENRGTSGCLVVDARTMTPTCRIALPPQDQQRHARGVGGTRHVEPSPMPGGGARREAMGG